MKHTMRLWGMIALAAVIGFTMTACPTEDDGGGVASSSSPLGPTLELKGQVYTVDMPDIEDIDDFDDLKVTYTPYNNNVTISDTIGTGGVTNGQLSYNTTTAPDNLEALEDYFYDLDLWDNIQISSSGVQGYLLSYLSVTSPNNYEALQKRYTTMKVSGNYTSATISLTDELVMYIYVDGDVAITGKGSKYTDKEDGVTYTIIINDFNLALKQGWNALYQKQSMSTRMTNTATTATDTMSISMANPSNLRWTLYEDIDDGSGYGSGSVMPPPLGQRSLDRLRLRIGN